MLDISVTSNSGHFLRRVAFWGLVGLLVWAPFPLGGAVAWASGVQVLAVAALLFLCGISIWLDRNALRGAIPPLVPTVLFSAALLWMAVQTLNIVPASWIHPIWNLAADGLHQTVSGAISLNPWQTQVELIKLLSYLAAGWIAYYLAQHEQFAIGLLHAIMAVGVIYSIYAFVLALIGVGQSDLLYSVDFHSPYISGPFLLHNSFATYSGLIAVAAVSKLFSHGISKIAPARTWRGSIFGLLDFTLGRGAVLVLATVLPFAAVVASASRAGFAATTVAAFVVGTISLVAVRRERRQWLVVGAAVCLAVLLIAMATSAQTLDARFRLLIDSGNADNVRLALWQAASRMVGDAPLVGLGLGTYLDAYPLYATQVLPFVMDKAHCDYLEFAAGVGLPAAIAWWLGLFWIFFLCARGVIVRRRNKVFPVAAIGAFALIALHSTVDFSLQLPAVALLFSVLIGLGLAQSRSTSERARLDVMRASIAK